MGLVELARYPNSATAYIVRGRLAADGIDAVCFDTGMNFAEGAQLLFPVRVMVLAEDLEEARKSIAQPVSQPPAAEPYPGTGWLKRRRRAHLLIAIILAFWAVWLLLFLAG